MNNISVFLLFYRFSHAANAFENCDKKYKAVFAEPRLKFSSNYDHHYVKNQYGLPPPPDMGGGTGGGGVDGCTKLQVIASPMINQDQLWKLFDIVPGKKRRYFLNKL